MLLLTICFAAPFAVLLSLVLITAVTARGVDRLPPHGRFLSVRGARLHYLEAGRGRGIVLVHGLGGQMGHFRYALLDRLQHKFRVILIDRPGCGHSDWHPETSGGLEAQADTIAEAIHRLGLERPLLVGHSLGAAVALAVALRHQNAVGGLALICPLTNRMTALPPRFRALAIESALLRWLVSWTLVTPWSIVRRHSVLTSVFRPDPVPEDFSVKAGCTLSLRPCVFQAAALDIVLASRMLADMVPRYGSLSVPVSVLHGQQDQVLDYREHALVLKEKLPGSELVLTSGGHMLPVTAPDLTAAFISRAASRLYGM